MPPKLESGTRYYISSRLKETGSERKDGWRLPAAEIEAVVLQQFTTLLADKVRLAGWIEQVGQSARIEVGLDEADKVSERLKAPTSASSKLREIIARWFNASTSTSIAFV